MRFVACILLFSATFTVAAEPSRVQVVTSALPLYCWASHVAGEFGSVENLLPSHADPHDYAFTPADARRLNHARLVVVNGLGLEAWLPKWRRNDPAAVTGRLVDISAAVESAVIRDNPHVWLDPQLACVAVSNITSALQRVDPPHASGYASNALTYIARLQQLDRDIAGMLAPLTNRSIVTYHDAFPYFARRYGLDIVGVVELVPEVNPTPKYLARLARTMREQDIRVIFVAQNSSSRLARQIAKDLRVRLVELDTLETGEAQREAYEQRMRANARVLREVLR